MMVIEVKRTRQSATQGMAAVFINGKKVIAFEDTIKMVRPAQKYYGGKCGDYASITPDSAFILGLFYHRYDYVYKHSELAKKAISQADNKNKGNNIPNPV